MAMKGVGSDPFSSGALTQADCGEVELKGGSSVWRELTNAGLPTTRSMLALVRAMNRDIIDDFGRIPAGTKIRLPTRQSWESRSDVWNELVSSDKSIVTTEDYDVVDRDQRRAAAGHLKGGRAHASNKGLAPPPSAAQARKVVQEAAARKPEGADPSAPAAGDKQAEETARVNDEQAALAAKQARDEALRARVQKIAQDLKVALTAVPVDAEKILGLLCGIPRDARQTLFDAFGGATPLLQELARVFGGESDPRFLRAKAYLRDTNESGRREPFDVLYFGTKGAGTATETVMDTLERAGEDVNFLKERQANPNLTLKDYLDRRLHEEYGWSVNDVLADLKSIGLFSNEQKRKAEMLIAAERDSAGRVLPEYQLAFAIGEEWVHAYLPDRNKVLEHLESCSPEKLQRLGVAYSALYGAKAWDTFADRSAAVVFTDHHKARFQILAKGIQPRRDGAGQADPADVPRAKELIAEYAAATISQGLANDPKLLLRVGSRFISKDGEESDSKVPFAAIAAKVGQAPEELQSRILACFRADPSQKSLMELALRGELHDDHPQIVAPALQADVNGVSWLGQRKFGQAEERLSRLDPAAVAAVRKAYKGDMRQELIDAHGTEWVDADRRIPVRGAALAAQGTDQYTKEADQYPAQKHLYTEKGKLSVAAELYYALMERDTARFERLVQDIALSDPSGSGLARTVRTSFLGLAGRDVVELSREKLGSGAAACASDLFDANASPTSGGFDRLAKWATTKHAASSNWWNNLFEHEGSALADQIREFKSIADKVMSEANVTQVGEDLLCTLTPAGKVELEEGLTKLLNAVNRHKAESDEIVEQTATWAAMALATAATLGVGTAFAAAAGAGTRLGVGAIAGAATRLSVKGLAGSDEMQFKDYVRNGLRGSFDGAASAVFVFKGAALAKGLAPATDAAAASGWATARTAASQVGKKAVQSGHVAGTVMAAQAVGAVVTSEGFTEADVKDAAAAVATGAALNYAAGMAVGGALPILGTMGRGGVALVAKLSPAEQGAVLRHLRFWDQLIAWQRGRQARGLARDFSSLEPNERKEFLAALAEELKRTGSKPGLARTLDADAVAVEKVLLKHPELGAAINQAFKNMKTSAPAAVPPEGKPTGSQPTTVETAQPPQPPSKKEVVKSTPPPANKAGPARPIEASPPPAAEPAALPEPGPAKPAAGSKPAVVKKKPVVARNATVAGIGGAEEPAGSEIVGALRQVASGSPDQVAQATQKIASRVEKLARGITEQLKAGKPVTREVEVLEELARSTEIPEVAKAMGPGLRDRVRQAWASVRSGLPSTSGRAIEKVRLAQTDLERIVGEMKPQLKELAKLAERNPAGALDGYTRLVERINKAWKPTLHAEEGAALSMGDPALATAVKATQLKLITVAKGGDMQALLRQLAEYIARQSDRRAAIKLRSANKVLRNAPPGMGLQDELNAWRQAHPIQATWATARKPIYWGVGLYVGGPIVLGAVGLGAAAYWLLSDSSSPGSVNGLFPGVGASPTPQPVAWAGAVNNDEPDDD
jgi:hypothetical protein